MARCFNILKGDINQYDILVQLAVYMIKVELLRDLKNSAVKCSVEVAVVFAGAQNMSPFGQLKSFQIICTTGVMTP